MLARALALALLGVGCASTRSQDLVHHRREAPPHLPGEDASGQGDAFSELRKITAASRYTVIFFFSRHCPCVRIHETRLRQLFATYHRAGIGFVAFDSESDSSPAIDATETVARNYPFPIVRDTDALLARAYRAEYAGYALLLDKSQRVLYRGGIDSDRIHLRSDATPYLAEALADAIVDAPVRRPEALTLGCSLRLR